MELGRWITKKQKHWFVISRSAVRVRVGAPLKSMTYKFFEHTHFSCGLHMGCKKLLLDCNFVLIWRVSSYAFKKQPAQKPSGARHVFSPKTPSLIAQARGIAGRASQTAGQGLGFWEMVCVKSQFNYGSLSWCSVARYKAFLIKVGIVFLKCWKCTLLSSPCLSATYTN